MITKGPIGLAIPAFAVGSHLIATRNWRQLLSPVWLAGVPILGVILFPVLKGNYDAFGWEGIELVSESAQTVYFTGFADP